MKRTILLSLTAALVLAACGSAASPKPSVAPTAAPTTAPLGDIVEVATEAGNFKTLLQAATAAGLVDTLKGAGPFTVFAPTDEAFAKLPAGTVEGLLKDLPKLKDILLYHVVAGAVDSKTVVTLTEATTVQGAKVNITVKDGAVYLNDTVKVTMVDIKASNGIIHVIDAVLLPPAPALGDIVEVATAAGTFKTLLQAATAAGLVDTLKGPGPFTVFAPTDEAFAKLPAGTLEALLADPAKLKDILLYHVVSGAVTADQVVTLTSATTVQGKAITIEVKDGAVILNGTVKVVTTDIKASNGVIHVIDAVLLPPAM